MSPSASCLCGLKSRVPACAQEAKLCRRLQFAKLKSLTNELSTARLHGISCLFLAVQITCFCANSTGGCRAYNSWCNMMARLMRAGNHQRSRPIIFQITLMRVFALSHTADMTGILHFRGKMMGILGEGC